MTTDTSPAPIPPSASGEPGADARWMDTVPTDWNGYVELQREVTASRHARESFRNWMTAHLDAGGDAARLGIGLMAAGEPAAALPHLQAADGDLPALLAGVALARARDTEAAATALSALTGSSSVGARARVEMLGLRFSTGDVEGLAAELDGLRAAGGRQADVHYGEGLVAELGGEHEAAVAALRAAIEADPLHAEATFRLAWLLDLHGADAEARSLYERFLDGTLPTHVGALINLGILLEDADQNRRALRCFQLVARADPRNHRARRYLADARASLEQYYDESRERKADKQNAVLRTPVTDFELSVRARNCLQRMNIHTLGDLVCRTESELLSFKNFGETSLQEVKDILNMKGLRLGMAPGGDFAGDGADTGLAALAPGGDVNEIKISDLDLSVRSRAALATLGITRVGDLTQTTETTLLSCKNFGQTSLDEIKSKLRGLGLGLAG